MLPNSFRQLRGCNLDARDGRAGELDDLIIEVARWTVRHLVVDTGNWLPGPRVLLPPAAAVPAGGAVSVALTRAQVRELPSAATAPTASRLFEQANAARYGNRSYWEGHVQLRDSAAQYAAPLGCEHPDDEARSRAIVAACAARRARLLSGRDLFGLRVDTADGACGRIRDLVLAADGGWALTGVLVQPRGWFAGPYVSLPPQAIEHIDWEENSVRVALTREEFDRVPAAA